jgi:hypothetical protein
VEIPKGAEYNFKGLFLKHVNGKIFCHKEKGEDFRIIKGQFHWVYYADFLPPMSKSLIPRPQPKPVYTQAMCDAGELPNIGMECMVYLEEEKAEVKGWFRGVVCGKFGLLPVIRLDDLDGTEGYFDVFSIENIKPVDTRSNEEKAFDDLLVHCERSSTHDGVINNILNAIKAGKIHGVTFKE